MKKLLVVPLALVVLLSWVGYSAAAMCDTCMGGMGMSGGHVMGERMMLEKMKALGLDEKQTAEVKAIHSGVRKETVRKKAELDIAGIELKEILGKDPVDLKAAEAKIRQMEALKGDMMLLHIKAHQEVKAKLTPEQKKKFESIMETMPMMGGMGMTGGCGMTGGMKGGMGVCGKCRMKHADDDDFPPMDMMDNPMMPQMEHRQMQH